MRLPRSWAIPRPPTWWRWGTSQKLLPEVPYDIIAAEVEKSFAAKPKLIPINLEALRKGYELNEG